MNFLVHGVCCCWWCGVCEIFKLKSFSCKFHFVCANVKLTPNTHTRKGHSKNKNIKRAASFLPPTRIRPKRARKTLLMFSQNNSKTNNFQVNHCELNKNVSFFLLLLLFSMQMFMFSFYKFFILASLQNFKQTWNINNLSGHSLVRVLCIAKKKSIAFLFTSSLHTLIYRNFILHGKLILLLSLSLW